ncbi:MAG: FkbM family methyltransferase [Bacteroidota bacterium]
MNPKSNGKLSLAGLKNIWLGWLYIFALWLYRTGKRKIYLIQLGAHDGISLDPMKSITRNGKTQAILIEAVPYLFEKLNANYAQSVNITPRNIAVTDEPETSKIPFYYLLGNAENPMPEYYSWWGSADKNHAEKFRYVASDFELFLKEEMIEAETVNTIFRKSGFPRLDILQIDVEGLDGKIIDSVDFNLITPSIIVFERIHCETCLLARINQKLRNQGYTLVENNVDTIAFDQKSRHSFYIFWLFQKWIPETRRRLFSSNGQSSSKKGS